MRAAVSSLVWNGSSLVLETSFNLFLLQTLKKSSGFHQKKDVWFVYLHQKRIKFHNQAEHCGICSLSAGNLFISIDFILSRKNELSCSKADLQALTSNLPGSFQTCMITCAVRAQTGSFCCADADRSFDGGSGSLLNRRCRILIPS